MNSIDVLKKDVLSVGLVSPRRLGVSPIDVVLSCTTNYSILPWLLFVSSLPFPVHPLLSLVLFFLVPAFFCIYTCTPLSLSLSHSFFPSTSLTIFSDLFLLSTSIPSFFFLLPPHPISQSLTPPPIHPPALPHISKKIQLHSDTDLYFSFSHFLSVSVILAASFNSNNYITNKQTSVLRRDTNNKPPQWS